MQDQIVDPSGQPVAEYNEDLDNAVLPVMGAPGSRMYLGLSKPELVALHLYASRCPVHEDGEAQKRVAEACWEAARVFMNAVRAPQ